MRALLPLLLLILPGLAQTPSHLPGTEPLIAEGDLSAQMVDGIGRWLERRTSVVAEERSKRWKEAARGPQWAKFADERRAELRRKLGIVDERVPGSFEELRDVAEPDADAGVSGGRWRRVRWPVMKGVYGEGLLFRPTRKAEAAVIAIPDADQLPEQLAWGQQLAQAGCVVLIPTLVSRNDRWSGNEGLKRFTNQPHREWIYRQAFEMGRTVIGYEVQKILAAIDTLSGPGNKLGIPDNAIGVAGYGEGGLLTLYCAALEPRVRAAMVSGYFQSRDRLYEEPIYRNVFGLLREFGDAQLASLVAPRQLIIERSVPPKVNGPPAPREGRKGAAPGSVSLAGVQAIDAEVRAAKELAASFGAEKAIALLPPGDSVLEGPGWTETIDHLLSALGVQREEREQVPVPRLPAIAPEDADARQRRTVRELEDFTQGLVPELERARTTAFWSGVKPGAEWESVREKQRERLWNDVIGKIPPEQILPPAPQTRVIRERPQWVAHEVKLDVLPDVFAWGWLLIPRDLEPGERRPVVVCQHGLEGVPEDVVNDDPKSQAFGYYKAFAARLAERGFIVYAPHNPYRGGDKFRMLQRRANPLGLSLFSFIIAQHDARTRWLAGLPFVDPSRIAFYGLSYGGKTAMRVPTMVDRYCLSICSGDFNEWVRKNVSTNAPYSYMFTGEWEMPEWNLAGVANYAEMAMLMAPRPFMVERGHDDGVGVDEWVAYEYAKVRRGYVKLGIGERTEIEWFNGPHTIHGVGTFEFLQKQLGWPKR